MANKLEDFWQPSFATLYDASFQELASESILTRWTKIHYATAILTAITASGSAVSGWALWNSGEGKYIWVLVASTASLFSIVHSALGVPAKIKEEEHRRQQFSALRNDIETFRHSLTIGGEFAEAKQTFDKLRQRLSENVSNATPDALVFTAAARKEVQAAVDEKLKDYIKKN
jgi:hypothetical protein